MKSVRNFFRIVALPQETFPLGESSKSPLHFAAHRDESVIVGYYTSALRPQARFEAQAPQAALSAKMTCIFVPRHLLMNPERRDALGKK